MRRRYRNTLLRAGFLFLLFAGAAAHGAGDPCRLNAGLDYRASLDRYLAADCYIKNSAGQPNPVYAAYVEVDLYTGDITPSQSRVTENTRNALLFLRQKIGSEIDNSAPPLFRENATRMLERLRRASAQLARAEEAGQVVDGQESGEWNRYVWTIKDNSRDSVWRELLISYDKSGCLSRRPKQDEACDKEYQALLTLLPFMQRMKETVDYYLSVATSDFIYQQQRRYAMWHSYLQDGLFQYPWELTINYCVSHPERKGESGWRSIGCYVPIYSHKLLARASARSPDAGWAEPPNQRVIFMHPSVGFAYNRKQPAGNQFSPSLVMQWYGRYFWSDYDRRGRIKNPMGVSVVSAYADLAGANDLGHGLMFFYRQYGLAVTKHSDEYQVFFGLNLLQSVASGAEKGERIKSLIGGGQ